MKYGPVIKLLSSSEATSIVLVLIDEWDGVMKLLAYSSRLSPFDILRGDMGFLVRLLAVKDSVDC